jgi:hypothetical protein
MTVDLPKPDYARNMRLPNSMMRRHARSITKPARDFGDAPVCA